MIVVVVVDGGIGGVDDHRNMLSIWASSVVFAIEVVLFHLLQQVIVLLNPVSLFKHMP